MKTFFKTFLKKLLRAASNERGPTQSNSSPVLTEEHEPVPAEPQPVHLSGPEKQMRRLWAKAIGITAESVGIGSHDDFFSCGGSPTSVLQLCQIAQEEGLYLDPRDIFENPRLIQLVKKLQNQTVSISNQAIPPFSLLGPATDCQEIRHHAAQLCQVKQKQILDVLPCTPLQAGLLALTQLDAGNYVAKHLFEIGTGIDLEIFRAAWDQVVTANPILRTRMVTLPGHDIVQVIINEGVQWVFEDSLELYQQNSLARESAFGLGDPLTRFVLIGSSAPGPRYFVWEIHHALYDGWSTPLILKDAEHNYYREAGPRLSSMPGLIQYIQGLDPVDVARFWAKMFRGLAAASFPVKNNGLSLDQCQDRQTIAREVSNLNWGRNNFTPTTVVRTAWATVQASRTNSNEALFGITVSGRQGALAGIEHLAGPTIATVPVRVQIDWTGSTSQLLESVQSQGADLIPFEQTGLQNIRRINDETRAACEFQSLLVIQPVDEGPDDTGKRPFLSEVQGASDLLGERGSGTYALEIECQLSLSELSVHIDFDCNAIPRGDVEEILDELQHVLRELAGFNDGTQSSDRPISSVLTPPKSMSQVSDWNATSIPPIEETVHSVIEKRARESPGAMAICAWDGEITYHQLDELSTQLAGILAGIPVTGTLVTLLFEKSLWMPVATLAVLKAGSALNALEMKHPEERLREIVAQTDSPLLLCSIQNEKLASRLQPKRLLVVGDNFHGSNQPLAQLPFVNPASLLYVVFTSGSTGKPKGVQITHSNMRSAITYQQTALQYNEKSRVFDFASYGFDVAWSNLFMTLTAGGCLCIPSAHERENELIRCLAKYDINFMDSTPSLARSLDKEVLSRLSTLILGGEAMLPSDALLVGDQTTIINAYGPAECTPTALISKSHADGVRIGRGYGCCPWVVDVENPSQLVPVGSVGELWLEGPIVGAGYLNDAEKTSAAFIRDPPWLLRHVGRTGRVYRTGDLVRYESDGSLVYIGRKDHQVKIRGQRVELGEIEITLERILHSIGARIVVEVVQLTDASTLTLVGFVTLPRVEGTTEAEHDVAVKRATDGLIDRLVQTLPSYMIPTTFFSLPVVPVTTTGKTDRHQLREKAKSLLLAMRANEADQIGKDEVFTSTESIIRDVWITILNLTEEETSLDADFARLGGDSISAMQIVSRCRMRNLQLTVSDILQARTIRKLARLCKTPSLQNELTNVLGPEDPSVPSELSPIQQDFFSLYPDGLNHYNQSFLLELGKPVSADALRNALSAIVSRHPMLRARFKKSPNNGSWQQWIAEDGPGAFAFATHTVHDKAAASSTAQWRQENLDIRQGPVFACDLFDVASGVQMVLLSAHHLVIDLVSWRILWGDLEDHIRHGSLRAPQTISFRRWCATQARLGQTLSPLEVLPYSLPDSQLGFWGIPLEENTFDQCETLNVTVSADVTALLFGMSNDSLHTEPVDLMLAAMIRGFALAFPERSVPPIWTEAHGREQLDGQSMDVSGTIGWFTAIFPLVVPITSTHSLPHAARLVKDIRRKVPGHGQPFSSCRAYSESGRRVFGGHDIVELVFNFTGRFQQLEKDDGMFQEPSSIASEGSQQFDLTQISGSAQRPSLIDLTLSVIDGELSVTFTVHKKMNLDRIQEWMHHFDKDLEDLCRGLSRAPSELTLADLSIPSSLSYRGLDALLQKSLPQVGVKASSVVDIYPCTALQEGMLLSAMKGAASYHTFTVWRCVSAVEKRDSPSLLAKAWQKVTKRHSILSTIFTLHPDGDGFIQIVLDSPVIRVAEIIPECDDPVTSLLKLEKPSFTPGDPQHSFTISQSSAGETFCRLDINHILTDAQSDSILLDELALAYDGCELQTAPMFSEIVKHNSKTSKAKALATKVANLEGIQPCNFPISSFHSRPAQPVRFGVVFRATPDIQADPTQFCKSTGILFSSFMHVAWAMVLSYYTGTFDVCFGYDISGRDAPIEGVDRLVGPLSNLLISRVRLNASANEILHAASIRAGQDLAFQNVSMADIQHHLRLSGRQLFNTSVSIHDTRAQRGATDKKISFQVVGSEDAHEFDLKLNVLLNHGLPDFVLEFQEPHVSRGVAEEIYGVLMQAINHLLTTTETHVSEPGETLVSQQLDSTSTLFDQFFTRVGGIERPVAEAFWKTQFADIRGSHFPAIKPTATQDRIYNEVFFDLKLCVTGQDFTADVILRAAWALLTTRLSNTDESLFGTATTGHGAGSILPNRILFSGEKSIGSFLSQIKQRGLELCPFKRMRLEQVACISNEAALACKLQSILVIHPRDERQTVSSAVVTPEGIYELCNPSLIVEARVEAESIHIQTTFDHAVMTAPEVTRLLHQLEHIIHQLVDFERRDTLLRSVTVASADDLNTIWSWNADLPSPVSGRVHDMIIERAKRSPESVAIDAWDGSMTYGQLDSLSSNLASQLVNRGIGSGSIVPLCFEKSMWMPVAALAVMRSGAVSVLIEMSYPEQRIRAIIDQVFAVSKRKLILSSPHHRTFCERFNSDYVLTVSEEFLAVSMAYEPPLVHPSDVLYIVFTSGTSGNPKGVIITHQNFCSAIAYQRDQLGFDANSRVFDFASNAFDVAWLNLLKTLSSGGCLCIPSAAERLDDLGGALEKYRATVVDLTPSVARTLPQSILSRLDILIFGGEAVSPSDFNLVGGATQIKVAYGPAECTPTSTILDTTASTDGAIGRAAGVCTWVVDLENPDALAPIGAPGELWIEGPLVGQGYLGNAERSAQAFVRNPAWLQRGSPDGQHSRRSGGLYRTGDLVRYNGDGSLVFLGRRDTQIKIRGQRVELADIESHIRRAIGTVSDEHAADMQVAVEYLHLKGSSDKSLVAFVSLGKDSAMLSSDDFNNAVQRVAAQATEQLIEQLPLYMLPSAYIPIQTIPVTTSGKIDRRQLQQIGTSLNISDVGRLSGKAVQKRVPETEIEIRMQSLWAKVLQIDQNQISADDNFFQWGGDSIGAMRLVALARYEELTLTVRDVFQHPVLSDLCGQCRTGDGKTSLCLEH
ncbi:non-ribosomal peptide synthetase [Penicillium sp. DV-2018c]|nr:non-ribosomal peptide synthetase [Penicillium sp. DV-2018c]